MKVVLSRRVGLYVASIIALLAIGITAGGITAEVGRNILHVSTQASQAILTVCGPLFVSVLELWGMKHFIRSDMLE